MSLKKHPRVPTISREGRWQIRFAEGWLGLGNSGEASKSLSCLSASEQNHPDVLALRWSVCAASDSWSEAFQVACQHLDQFEEDVRAWINHSYALRRMEGGGLDKAWSSLIRAHDRFPNEMLIPYNLACYKCQLGEHEAAMELFKQALANGTPKDIIAMARKDSDLAPLLALIEAL